MKRSRILFLTAVTLLVATPSFAQLCGYCDFWGDCWAWPGLGTACSWDENNWCYEWPEPYYCGGGGLTSPDAVALSDELTIASVEVVTPAAVEVTTSEEVRPVHTARLE